MNKRIFLSPPWMSGNELPLIEEAFASNYIAPCGPMVDRFERQFAQAVGLPHACALSSGTAALELLFHELKIGAGDLVFCSDLTFVASIGPAVHRGAAPVFIDCDASTWTMNPDLLEEALAEAARAGRLPKVVVAADLYGQCCHYERIEEACAKYEVPLIIDAAEALGARFFGSSSVGSRQSAIGRKGEGEDGGQRSDDITGIPSFNPHPPSFFRMAGDAGWAAVYSFNGNKIITTSGGGMLASRDAGVVERARKRSQQAREPVVWYEHQELGYNHRMSNIVAAIGVGQLACLESIIQKKRQIFEWYRQRLGARVGLMPEAAYGRCTRWLTVVQLGGNGRRKTEDGKDAAVGNGVAATRFQPSAWVERVRLALEAGNIESRPVWKPMHLQPVFHGAKVYGGACSERLFANGLCLPSGAALSEADVERIGELIANVLAQSGL